MAGLAPAVKAVARTQAHRHQAVVGFLFGLIVILVLHTTMVFGPFRSTNEVVLQSTSGEQNASTSSPPASPVSSAPNNSTQAAVHDIENGQKDDVAKNDGERRDQLGQTVKNDASDNKMQEELIRQELDQDIKHGVPGKPLCDLSDPRYDICEITGDARAIGANRTVLYVPPADERGTDDGPEWAIKDQSRKNLGDIAEVKVKTLSTAQSLAAPECTSRHAVPAVVFAMNGITGNPWHDLSDVLIPLFITTRAYDGEVQFLVTELQPWFVDKYRLVLTNLSRYDIVDFNKDAGVRCYPHIVVGLRSHGDLDIDPARTSRNYTLLDFRLYIRDVFSLPSDGRGIPYKEASKKNATDDSGTVTENQMPRLLLINRGMSRKFVNLPEISAAVQAAGFEVLVMEPGRDMRLEEFTRAVDSCDVLMGVHGAALTNFFFLRTNAAVLQVVGLGLEREAMHYYGNQAKKVMLQHIEYFISAEESTLYEKYGKDHPAVSDPDSVHKQGWQGAKRYFWAEQDIRLNVTRFAPTLHQLLRTLRE